MPFGACNWDGPEHMLGVVLSDFPHLMPKWYLMLSHAYYAWDVSAVSDSSYDKLCRELHSRWDEAAHPLKFHVDKRALLSGTGFYLGSLPETVIDGAEALVCMIGT